MIFAQKLLKRVLEIDSNTCLTLRPNINTMPAFLIERITEEHGYDLDAMSKLLSKYGRLVVDVIKDRVAVLNLDLVFFEQYGPFGLMALFEIAQEAREEGMLVMLDGERLGDREQMSAYSRAYLGQFAAFGQKADLYPLDAATVSPFYGFDSLAPVFEEMREHKKGAFIVLGNQANSSRDLLNQPLEMGETVDTLLAQFIASWSDEVEEDVHLHSLGVKMALDIKRFVALRKLLPTQPFWVTLREDEWGDRKTITSSDTWQSKVLVEGLAGSVLLEVPPVLVNMVQSKHEEDFRADLLALLS